MGRQDVRRSWRVPLSGVGTRSVLFSSARRLGAGGMAGAGPVALSTNVRVEDSRVTLPSLLGQPLPLLERE